MACDRPVVDHVCAADGVVGQGVGGVLLPLRLLGAVGQLELGLHQLGDSHFGVATVQLHAETQLV